MRNNENNGIRNGILALGLPFDCLDFVLESGKEAVSDEILALSTLRKAFFFSLNSENEYIPNEILALGLSLDCLDFVLESGNGNIFG